MPLLAGAKNIGRNIRELQEHGTRPRSQRQITAIALNVARSRKKEPQKSARVRGR